MINEDKVRIGEQMIEILRSLPVIKLSTQMTLLRLAALCRRYRQQRQPNQPDIKIRTRGRGFYAVPSEAVAKIRPRFCFRISFMALKII